MRAWQSNLLGVAAAGAVVGGGLFVGAPDVAATGPSNPLTLAAPPTTGHGRGEIPLGEAIELWGQPSRLNMFWTSDTAEEVLRTYGDAWKAAGLTPQFHKMDMVSGVSIVDKATGLMRMVTVLEAGDERVVIPGLTDIRVVPELTPVHAPVPVPENATAYLANVADDTSTVSYNSSFMVALEPERTIEFYKVELGKDGYHELANPEVKRIRNGRAMEFERGPEWIQVVATTADPKKVDAAVKRGEVPAEFAGRASFVAVTHIRRVTQGPLDGARP